MICQWQADQIFAKAEGQGKRLIAKTLTNHNILQYPSSMTVLLLNHCYFDQLKMQNHSMTDWGTMVSIVHEQNTIGSKTLI